MLSFFDTFMTMSVSVLHDADTDENVLLVPKNASRALVSLTETNPERYSIIYGNKFEKLTVFIRDPVDRIISGLHTMSSITKIPVEFYISEIERAGIAGIMNAHILPQFLYLIKSQTEYFQIEPLKNVSRLVDSKGTCRWGEFSLATINRLRHQYTEDEILAGLGEEELSLNELILKIRNESNFVESMKQ